MINEINAKTQKFKFALNFVFAEGLICTKQIIIY